MPVRPEAGDYPGIDYCGCHFRHVGGFGPACSGGGRRGQPETSRPFYGFIPGHGWAQPVDDRNSVLHCWPGLWLAIYMRLKNLPVHRAMLEVSELIYETCKT